jgi:mono/diheme cytochrome c family protein
MRTLLKWIGILLGVLVVVLAIAAFAVFALSESRANRVYDIPVAAIDVPIDAAAIARGEHLLRAVGDCTECHGENLGGLELINDPMVGVIYSANLTSGQGGAANLTTEEFVRAFRHGVAADGKPLWLMPSGEFKLSDEDLGAAIAYLRSLPPVDNVESEPRMGPLGRVLAVLNALPAWPVETIDHAAPPPVMPPEGATAEYGAYLAGVAACGACHGADYRGGPVPGESPDAPLARNLTPAGKLAGWTAEDFITALRTGQTPAGLTLSTVMPWPSYQHMTDDELTAIFLFLQSLPPVESDL